MSDITNGSNSASNAPAPSQSSAPAENNANLEANSAPQGQSQETVEAQIQADPNLSNAEKKKLIKQLEIKYNGKTEKVDLPFELPEEAAEWMRTKLQKEKLATQKSQEYSALEKDIVSFFQALKENPRKALANPNYGVDLKKVAAEIIEEELANAAKSPEQLALEEKERKLAEYEEREKQREAEYKEYMKQQQIEKAANEFDNAMAQALEQYKIPKGPYAVKRMAEYMHAEIKKGQKPDMDLIASKVEAEMSGDYKATLSKMSIEDKIKFLGEDLFEEARKYRLSKAKKAPASPKSDVKDVAKQAEQKSEPVVRKNYKDFFGV